MLSNWYEEQSGALVGGKRADVTTGEVSKYYEILREREEREAEKRRAEVYKKVPRIKEIEEKLSASAAEMAMMIVSDRADKEKASEEMRQQAEAMNIEEAFLLTDNGFDVDYMEVRYTCDKCKDTGVLESGERCQCYGEVTREKIDLVMNQNS